MSTVYRGKINFTKDELMTKYDNISLVKNIQINLSLPYAQYSLKLSDRSGKKSYNNYHIKSSHFTEDSRSYNVSEKRLIETKMTEVSSIEDWMDLVNDNVEVESIHESRTAYQIECIYCRDEASNIPVQNISYDSLKITLMNGIVKCILYGLKGGSDLPSLCSDIYIIDPEFLLKASLFCRKEFNVRTVANYLLALSSSISQCNIYLKKYFSACVNLPTDWMEVVQQYMIIAKSIKLPSQLRKVLVSKFREFNTYQIGKYQHKTLEVDIGSLKINLSLKSLIRTLHISEPVDHVMCLLGKTYPKSNEEFVASNLPGQWDHDKAGKRMKVPTPETWETQISIQGNKPEVWEKLIDTKKLPYMAMIRNLRNILQANVKDRYHDKVSNMIAQESKVINGKLLPFQYFTAFKILEDYNEDITKAKEKLAVMYNKTASQPKVQPIKTRGKKGKPAKDPNDKRERMRTIMRLRKAMGRPLVSEIVIEKYMKALNKAVEISTTYNIPCIRGRVLILSNISDETIYPKFKHGSSKSVKEIVALLTSMCYYASEYAEIALVDNSLVKFYQVNKKSKSILTLSSEILTEEINSIMSTNVMLEEMITKQRHYDIILSFDVILPKYLLERYTKCVNPAVSIFVNTIASDIGDALDIENITTISGFNEHSIKIISEQSNGGFIEKVNSIDKRYNLDDNVICFKKADDIQKDNIDSCEEEESHTGDVNIFISSTFLDMDKERSLINKVIIPAVKKELKMKNINFINVNCIDLRWGVPSHMGCSEQMVKYCIEQVRRCHIFIGLLGFRYGWIPDTDIIRNVSDIYPELSDYDSHSITHLEYKLAPSNCHRIFLLQSSQDICTFEDRVEGFRNEIKAKELFYEYSPENMLSGFKVLVTDIARIVSENFVRPYMSVTHICMKHQRPHRQKLLKQSITRFIEYSSKYIETQEDSVDEIIALLEHDLKIKVKLFFEKKLRDEDNNPIDKKNIPIKATTDKFGGIVLVEGKAGSGKTSLLVGLIKEAMLSTYETKYHISRKVSRNNFIWFYDSVKYIYDQNGKQIALDDLLYDMIEFLMNLGYDFTKKLKNELNIYGDVSDNVSFWRSDVNSTLTIWYALLKIIDMVDNIQVTFFIDGLEKLSNSTEACSLSWIPSSLSSKVRFVITSGYNSTLARCTKMRNDHVVYEVKSIPMKFKRKVIENILMAQGKSLDATPFNNHMSELTLKSDSDKPKFLGLVINHLLLYGSFDKVKDMIRSLPSTIDLLILHCLKSIEKEIPKEICTVYFAFIYHGKSGFRIGDLQKLMSVYFQVRSKKNKVSVTRDDFNELKVASQFPGGFSLYPLILIRNLSHLLLEEDRSQRIFIRDESVSTIIHRYCETVNIQVIHYIISLHYDDLIIRSSDEIAYRDIIYHKNRAMMFDECLQLLTNINYIRDRFEINLGFGLLKDFDGYRDNQGLLDETWSIIRQTKKFTDFNHFVSRNFDLLKTDHELFLQQVLNEPFDSYVYMTQNSTILKPFDFCNDDNVVFILEQQETNHETNCSQTIGTNERINCAASETCMGILALGFESGLIQIYNYFSLQICLTLKKHTLRINSLNFISESQRLVSVGEDMKALVWDATNGSLLRELSGHQRSVMDSAYCHNAGLICTVGLDSQCILWKQDSYILHHAFKSKSPINCVRAHNSKIIIGCWNGNMIIYNAVELTKTAVIHNSSSVRSVSINGLYPTFLATNIQGHLSIWNSNKGLKLKEFSTDYNKYPTCGMYSRDGLTVLQYSGHNSQHQTVSIWNASIGCHANKKNVEDVCCIDSNSEFIICGNRYGTVILLDVLSLEAITSHNVCEAELTAISFNRSEKLCPNCFAVTDYYCTLHIFEISEQTIILKYKIDRIHSRPINCLVWSSYYVLTGSDDCSINVVDLKERLNENFMSSIKDVFLNSVLSLDVRKGWIIAGCKDKSIGLFSIKTKSILNHHIHAHDDWVTCIRFISSVSFISSSNDCSIKIWQINIDFIEPVNNNDVLWTFATTPLTLTVLHTLVGHMSLVTSLAYDKSELIASASNDGTIKLWKLQGFFVDNIVINNNKDNISEPNDSIQWIKFHKTNGTLLALERSGNLHTFNFQDINCLINKLTSHRGPITSISDIGETIITSSLDFTIKKWHFNDIVSKKKIEYNRIIDSLNVTTHSGFRDVIVGYADTGYLIYWALDSEVNTWRIIDKVDVKVAFQKHELHQYFTSPYLICECLKTHGDDAIDILFSKLTLRININSKTIQKLKLENPQKFVRADVDCSDIQVNENRFMKFIQKGRRNHFVRIAKGSTFLELFSLREDKSKATVVTKIQLHGDPYHIAVTKTCGGDNVVFIGYEQGTVDFITIKQIVF